MTTRAHDSGQAAETCAVRSRVGRHLLLSLTLVLALVGAAACSSGNALAKHGASVAPSPSAPPATSTTPAPASPSQSVPAQFADPLPGMPPVQGDDVYAASRAGMVSLVAAHDPALLYVPDAAGARVTVISQATRKIILVLKAGQLSQHVTPSYDLRWLYVNSSAANQLVVIDPRTARVVRTVSVPRPYNLYFTPDGKQAVVMVEQRNEIRFSDPTTFAQRTVLKVPGCRGPNHADFSANGQYFVVTCEFSGELLKVSTVTHRLVGAISLGAMSMPQDVRLAPDGRTFYVAVMGQNRVLPVNGDTFKPGASITTVKMPHGLYPSRDGRFLYVSDRGAGKISVVSFATNRIVATWTIPGGGSPDMGGVSADGSMLWLSGRYDGVVYGLDTRTGKLVTHIRVGGSPHGLAVWPQPGRYSMGHTGNMR